MDSYMHEINNYHAEFPPSRTHIHHERDYGAGHDIIATINWQTTDRTTVSVHPVTQAS